MTAEPRNRLEDSSHWLVLLAGATAIVALTWHHIAILGDGFWYIATGRWILRHHGLPTSDPFCFATVQQAWTVVSVGSQVLFAGALLLPSWFALREHKDPLQHVPAKAAEVSRALPQNIMNPYHWGGYLAYAWNGNPEYFIDGRDIIGLVSNGILDDSARLRAGTEDWQRILDTYEIKTVVWERGAPLDFCLAHASAWKLMHRDALAVVYMRHE
jgi:hypothetical protein